MGRRFAFILFMPLLSALPASDLSRLSILDGNWPRAFFFRTSENIREGMDEAVWSSNYGRLGGIMGKCLDEEVVGRGERNPAVFSRFKRERPEQLVLLHFNGNARDPRFRTASYFPGHWIHRAGVKILEAVAAEAGETDIAVADPGAFLVNTGRYKNANDDIALFRMGPDGRYDWDSCEQVQLISVDAPRGKIRVRRGCYGTKPKAFPASSMAAAHETEGPWGKNNHLLWYYNYSTTCPKDREGRTAAQRLVDDLALWFGPGGELAAFDGLEFDVLYHQTSGDCDGDGVEDKGVFAGVNRYGLGVAEFCAGLRSRLGENRLILADGALGLLSDRSQRAFASLNGIESEGWPHLRDKEIEDWSGGMNRHFFWASRARAPVFNYVNHKFTVPTGEPGGEKNPDLPFSTHRLVMAAAQMFDAALTYAFAPPKGKDELIGVWDELVMGREAKRGWLGKATGPAMRLADSALDLLSGREAASILAGERVERLGDGGARCAAGASATRIEIALPEVPCRGPDLFVTITARGEPMKGYPASMPRQFWVEASGGLIDLSSASPTAVGICLRGGTETALDPASGAVCALRKFDLGDRQIPGFSVHPPYKKGPGYVYWEREADLPSAAKLSFRLGMSERAVGRSDGVVFRVSVAPLRDGKAGSFAQIFEHAQKPGPWTSHSVDLSRLAASRVRLKFVCDPGPADNTVTDQAQWGDVKILGPGGEGAATETARFMGYVDGAFFASTFYFSGIRSSTVNLALSFEGNEPVFIRSVVARAAPDALWRAYERGLVLANPSPRPVVFDLEKLSPGVRYRRLRGTPLQDPVANDGSRAGAQVTLGGKDGLFLARE